MPSVRVRRGYTNLEESRHTGPDNRPRTYSSASAFQPPAQTPGLRDSHPSVDSETHLRAAKTHQDARSREPLLRAPPSKVSQHLADFGHGRARRQSIAPGPQYDQTAYLSPSLLPRRGLSFGYHDDRTDMISLQGQSENVMVARAEREPGRIGSALSLPHNRDEEEEYNTWDGNSHPDDIVEHLDVIDPQIATVSTLANAANAIVIPPLSFYSRKPVVVLPRGPKRKTTLGDLEKGRTEEYPEDNLDEHIEDVLRKRDRFRRVMQGVWSFMKTPIGIITSIYGFLVVFWGTALVFFLAKFIDLHNQNTQDFWVEVSQQIETSLFSITSIGLMPFRIMDTYRIAKIWWYKRKTRILRAKAGLPELYDEDDLPDPVYDKNYVRVLSEKDQIELHYQQHRFMESQTWYRPHGTQTHRAFPINIAITICMCNDLNSLFQCMLSACMWSMTRFNRPAWTTAVTLPAAFVAGILAGVYIWWGGHKTKRVKEVTERLRIALAMETPKASGSQGARVRDAPGAFVEAVGAPGASQSTDTSPTLLNAQPHCRDFAATTPGLDKGKLPAPPIKIADEMTVPSAEELDETCQ